MSISRVTADGASSVCSVDSTRRPVCDVCIAIRMERVALQPTSVTLLGAANLLGRTPREIRRLVRTGQLHAARRGRHYHIDRRAVKHYKVQRSLPS